MKISRLGAIAVLTTAAVLALTSCAANEGDAAPAGSGAESGSSLSGMLTGIGASSMATAQETWVAQFQTTNPDVTVNYSPDGSGAGREAFAGGGADFAGSDRAMKPEEMSAEAIAKSRCDASQGAMNLPVYISPIAIIYNVKGVTDLKLDADTLAGIFAGKITKWNDPKIAAANDGASLPDQNITPVHRADDSGTTENFTDYLHQVAPTVWTSEPDGEWPLKGGEAAPQTSGMVDTVTNGNGTIGYADASKAAELSTPTPNRPTGDLALDVARDTTEAGAYPVILISYQIVCLQYEKPTDGDLVKAFETYVTSAEGQDAAGKAAGSAPLTDALRTKITASIAMIKGSS